MNIDWVIPCRYVEVHDNLGTLVGAGIDTYWVQALPAPIQVVLAIRLLALPEELQGDEPQPITNVLKDPSGKTLGEITAEMTVAAEAHVERPDWLAGVMMTTVSQFQAAEEGTYTIEISIAGSTYPVPIHIVHGPPPGAPPLE